MFEYQGNRNQSQSISRNRSFQGNQFSKEGPYSRLNQNRPHDTPVNSEELHQNDDNSDGVDYSFSHMSVKERKKLFQQNQNNNSAFGPRTPSGMQNRGMCAHETMSDIGDTQVWRSKANTWTPRPAYNNQASIHSPQLSPPVMRNENRGSSVFTFEPQMTSSVHARSRTLDSASFRNNELNRFTFNDPMTRSAAFFNPRPDYSVPAQSNHNYNRQVSGSCTRVIPSRTGSSMTHAYPSQPPQTVYHRQESGYDSYFEKSRVSSPHADRYRSQVHIPLAMGGGRNAQPSFNWHNPRQSRSQQPLRVNVYSNHDRSADGRGQVYVPINPQTSQYISASTSVSPNRLYNDTVYYAYPANSTHYPTMGRNVPIMRPGGFYYDNHYRTNAQNSSASLNHFSSRSQMHLSSTPNIRSYSPPALARTSPNSYVLHDPRSAHSTVRPSIVTQRPSFHQVPASNHHTTQFRTFHQRPQGPCNTGFYQPMKIKTTPLSQWTPGPTPMSGGGKIRERTPMPVRPESKFWTSAGTSQPKRNVSAQRVIHPQPHAPVSMAPASPVPPSNRRTSNGAFFDEEAGISEF